MWGRDRTWEEGGFGEGPPFRLPWLYPSPSSFGVPQGISVPLSPRTSTLSRESSPLNQKSLVEFLLHDKRKYPTANARNASLDGLYCSPRDPRLVGLTIRTPTSTK